MSDNKGMLIRGRFQRQLTDVMQEINASISFDQKMADQDIRASIAHALMLKDTGIITEENHKQIHDGLHKIAQEIESGTFNFSKDLEDIHMNVEYRLRQVIGDAAGRLHTARSRNDQVATDFKLWVRDSLDRSRTLLIALMRMLTEKASAYHDAIMPGYTHLQSAQPTTFGHHLLAYVEMFERDLSRNIDAKKRSELSPLGSAALAGTSFPIDRKQTALQLGFSGPMRNSLDGVSDRDFALDYLNFASVCMVHMSRLSEEIVLWMSPQFGFIRLSDEWTTGSSIMPQKRNPDAAELIRGKTGRVVGSLQALLMTMKGLPLTFSKDMQEDKEQTFDAAETLELCLQAMTGMLENLEADREAMHNAAGKGYATATDLADRLVQKYNLPFQEAHHLTGQCVQLAESLKVDLHEVPLAEFQKIYSAITSDIYNVLSVENSVNSRVSFGGTAPKNVLMQVEYWRSRLTNFQS